MNKAAILIIVSLTTIASAQAMPYHTANSHKDVRYYEGMYQQSYSYEHGIGYHAHPTVHRPTFERVGHVRRDDCSPLAWTRSGSAWDTRHVGYQETYRHR